MGVAILQIPNRNSLSLFINYRRLKMFGSKPIGTALCCAAIIISSLCSKDNSTGVNRSTISLSNSADAQTLFYLLSRTHASIAHQLTPSFYSPYVEYSPSGGTATIKGTYSFDSTMSGYFFTYHKNMGIAITFNKYCFSIDSFVISGSSSFSWSYSYNQYANSTANSNYYSYFGNCNVSFLTSNGDYLMDSVSYKISENIKSMPDVAGMPVSFDHTGTYKIYNSKGTLYSDSGSFTWWLLP